MTLFGEKLAFGIDVGTKALKLIGVRDGKQPYVEYVEVIDYEKKGLVIETDIVTEEVIVALLKKLRGAYNLRSHWVGWTISGDSVEVYRVKSPEIENREIAGYIRRELADILPWNPADTEIDYDRISGTEIEGSVAIVVGAVNGEALETDNRLLELARFSANVIEPSGISLYNAFEALGAIPYEVPVALLNVGYKKTEAVVTAREVSPVFRTIPYGTADWGRLPDALKAAGRAPGGITMDGDGDELEHPMKPFAVEIISVCRHFQVVEQTSPVEQIVLTGGGAARPAVREAVESLTGIETRIWSPSESIPAAGKCYDYWLEAAPVTAEALGAALRGISQ